MKQALQLIHYSLIFRSFKTPESYNEWMDEDFMHSLGERFHKEFSFKDFVIGLERGDEKGILHLQCYIRLNKKTRLQPLLKKILSISKLPDGIPDSCVQLEGAKSTKHLKDYCLKDNNIVQKSDYADPYTMELRELKLNKFQRELYDSLHTCNERQIVLGSCEVGSSGKTTLIKYLYASKEYNTIVYPQSGSLASTLFILAKMVQRFSAQSDKDICICINSPRSDSRLSEKNIYEFLSAIESLKDGLFSSSFQSNFVTLNIPPDRIKIIILSNKGPEEFLKYLSYDRWVIHINK